MSDLPPPAGEPAGHLPPILRAELSQPFPTRSGWAWTIAPAYAGLFIWIPLLDLVGLLVAGGLDVRLVFLGSILALLACSLLLYYPAAILGCQSGQGLGVVASTTLGTIGAEWIVGILGGLGGLLVYAISIDSSVRLTMLGLTLCGLVGPASLERSSIGAAQFPAPITLITAAFWIYVTGTAILLRLASVVRAMMQVYTPVALALLVVAAILAARGPGVAVAREPVTVLPAFALLIQIVCSAFAFSGLLGADWGRMARDRLDVMRGGAVGINLAGMLGLVMTACTVSLAFRTDASGMPPDGGSPPLLIRGSFHSAIYQGIGGQVGGILLMLLGLATLAPACYAIWLFGRRFADHWGVLRVSSWTWLGGGLALAMIASGVARDSMLLIQILGALFAPVAGTFLVELTRTEGHVRGIRDGVNPPGVIAWGLGLTIGLIPIVGAVIPAGEPLRRLQPASLYAFAVSAATYAILARLGWERPIIPIRTETPTEPGAVGRG
ncbi:hypothetical protein [Aquisphaera insulae]|uniref:hypothetical protein n=1 Tax=Aquisphaera insulae TaxID=2712864 RepID=UPI0013EC8439|nr:hypothetical protein [Aquisphaera insulae]